MVTVDFVSLSINSSNIFSLLSALQFEIIWGTKLPKHCSKVLRIRSEIYQMIIISDTFHENHLVIFNENIIPTKLTVIN